MAMANRPELMVADERPPRSMSPTQRQIIA